MSYYLVKLLSYVICLLPDKLRNKLGDIIGVLCWPLVPAKRRTMATNNVMQAFGAGRDEAAQIARQSAVRFGRMFLDVLCFPKLNRRNIDSYITLVGRNHLAEACALGRGVVLITSHSGNWELMGAALALNDFPIVGVAQKQTNAAMDKFINEYRTLSGMKIVYKTGVREMIALLGEGMIIGLLIDQDAKEQGAFVDFFGRPASTPQGAAALARLKEVPIIPAFSRQNDDGTSSVIIHPPVWVTKTADRDADLLATTQELTSIVERHIRARPHEWFWLHNRWKTRPPDENF